MKKKLHKKKSKTKAEMGCQWVNSEEEEVMNKKVNVTTRTKGYKLVMNKFKLEIRRKILTIRTMLFLNNFLIG